jgi:4-amino-4-deoxy-L-arabinose transferase-like glycosyltransferase
MAGSGSSKPSPGFDLAFVLPLLAALSTASAAWFLGRGYVLYYGDAQAHLNIARRVFDSRTPGYYQIGTVWLPLPHALMLPFVGNDEWWQSGLAGVVPSAACCVIAGCFFYAAVRRALAGRAAAVAALAVMALNPNLLYLQSAPMTEPVFLACLAALLYFTVRFEQTQSAWCVVGAAVAALAGTLTRYEGWFLLPFAAAFFLVRANRRRWLLALLFCTIASLGPLYWLFHNWCWWGDALEFYRGPFSAKAIYERSLAEGMARYPGDHDWGKAWLHFHNAARLCAGWPLVWLGLAGVAAGIIKRVVWPLALLALPAAFYVASLHSGGTPIYVPQLWPNTYYNTRYGLAALPLLALGAGALVMLAPRRFRALAAGAIIAGALAPWAIAPRPESWICWKESQVNSEARRAWTKEAAEFLRVNYRRGAGIFLSFGDLAGILQQAGIPLRESLHTGNVPHWDAAILRPDLLLWEEWAIAISGDKVSDAMVKLRKTGPRYDCVRTIAKKGGPVIEIYRRKPVTGYAIPIFPVP